MYKTHRLRGMVAEVLLVQIKCHGLYSELSPAQFSEWNEELEPQIGFI